MSGNSEREGSLPADLQRCRRLVAVMRGQVLAPSRKRQVLQQLLTVITKEQDKRQAKWWANDTMPSPRARYSRDIQVSRIKVIQKRWRRHMLQKRIMAKLRMGQKWRSRQGISRFRKSALIIQRIFRGHFVRKHKIDIASYLAGLVSKLERLRSDRKAYHLKGEHIEQELQQIQLEIDIIRDKTAEEEKAAALFVKRGATAVDNSGIHANTAEIVEYYKAEIAELEELAHHLEKELLELQEQEPAVHLAATLIQALHRGVHCRMERVRERQRQRQIYSRMLQSKELCYDRMHSAWVVRNQKFWDASAKIIAGLYRIQQAKCERRRLRRDRAAGRILRLYRDVQARTTAKQGLQWKKAKRKAYDIASRKLRALLHLTWSGWLRCVQREVKRRQLITEHELAGLAKWCGVKARTFLTAYRERVAKRELLEHEIMHQLDTRVLHHIRTAVQGNDEEPSTQTAQEISSTFLLMVRNDVWTWQIPDKQLYFLAHRYNVPLDPLPLKQAHHWLAEEAPNFVDLYAPLPTQTLLALGHLSQFFSLHSRVLLQAHRVQGAYEAHMLMREYLALLYTANVVRLSPSTTFSSQQRQRAVAILQKKDRAEYLPIAKANTLNLDMKTNSRNALVQRDAFTSFYCVWNHHLCERCLAMRSEGDELSRRCNCCGHHQYEANTVTRELRLESSEVSFGRSRAPSPAYSAHPTRMTWTSKTERCDFLILNAFLHVLAPVNHDSRRIHSVDTLWKLAMSSAHELVVELYDRLPGGSLNDLLNAPREELEASMKNSYPPGVSAQLHLFITILKDECTQVDAQLAFEAQFTATVCSQERCPLRNQEPLNSMIREMVKRKKSKRVVRPDGRLKPLAHMKSTTQ